MPGVQRATWGIAVQSLARNERLFDLNPRTLMVPASVAKLRERRDRGRCGRMGLSLHDDAARGRSGRAMASLHGDLLVVGSGDPAIGGRGGDDFSTWIEALKAAGIHRIDGRIIGVDDSYRGTEARLRVVVGRPRLFDRRNLRRAQSCGEPTDGRP